MRSFLRVTIALMVLALAVTSISVLIRFFPSDRYELSRSGQPRLFAHAINSSDETIHIKASDWPHTFWKPFNLGDSEWRENYAVSKFYRSKDASVVAFFAREKSENEPHFVAAYDYRNHAAFDWRNSNIPKEELSKEISRLMEDRGGRADSHIDIPGLNSGFYRR